MYAARRRTTRRRLAAAKLPEIPIHAGDMRTFDLGSTLDAVTCLFSSIGYLHGLDELYAATARMAAHLDPGGVLVIEPWFTPEQWRDGNVSHTVVQTEDRTVVRMGFVDEHVMTLFTAGEYEHALAAAGLTGIGWEGGWAEGRDRLLGTRPA